MKAVQIYIHWRMNKIFYKEKMIYGNILNSDTRYNMGKVLKDPKIHMYDTTFVRNIQN